MASEDRWWFDSPEEALEECRRRNAVEKFLEAVPVEHATGRWTINLELRKDWKRFSTSDRVDRPVRSGERFVVRDDVEVHVMTHWRAPFTGGHTAMIPRGTIVVASHDQSRDAPGFYSAPEDYDRMEAVLVPENDRQADKYDGYSLSFVLDDIGTKLEPV